mgnify:FL=1
MSNIIITPSKNNVFGVPIEIGFHDNVNDNYDENKDLPYPIAPPFGYKNTIYIKLNNDKLKKYIMNNNDLSERSFNLVVSDVNDNSPITLTYNNTLLNQIVNKFEISDGTNIYNLVNSNNVTLPSNIEYTVNIIPKPSYYNLYLWTEKFNLYIGGGNKVITALKYKTIDTYITGFTVDISDDIVYYTDKNITWNSTDSNYNYWMDILQ